MIEKGCGSTNLLLSVLFCTYLGLYIDCLYKIPRDTKDNRHSGHVGVPNKGNNQNSFIRVHNEAAMMSGENAL